MNVEQRMYMKMKKEKKKNIIDEKEKLNLHTGKK